jgi:hypothetical protein
MTLEFSWQIFEKSPNVKFHEDPCSGSRIVPCRRTDMTKLIIALRNFAIAPKNASQIFVKCNMLMCWCASDLSSFVCLSVSCQTVCRSVATNCCFMSDTHTRVYLLHFCYVSVGSCGVPPYRKHFCPQNPPRPAQSDSVRPERSRCDS